MEKVTLMRVFGFLICLVLGSSLKASEAWSCPRNYYQNPDYRPDSDARKCLSCTVCPVGFGIRQHCRAKQDTVCERCLEGFSFASGWGTQKYCRPCKTCGAHRDIAKKCTLTTDTDCSDCRFGYYWNSIYIRCEPCSWCYPDVISPYDAFVVSECVRPEIPANYRCSKLASPPYHPQPTWKSHATTVVKQSQKTKGTGESHYNAEQSFGSGDDVGLSSGDAFVTSLRDDAINFLTDDEDIISKSLVMIVSAKELPTKTLDSSISAFPKSSTSASHSQSGKIHPTAVSSRFNTRYSSQFERKSTKKNINWSTKPSLLRSLRSNFSTDHHPFDLKTILILTIIGLSTFVLILVVVIIALKMRNQHLKRQHGKYSKRRP